MFTRRRAAMGLGFVLAGLLCAPARAITFGSTTDLYLLEFGRGAILKITPGGAVSEAVSRSAIDTLLPGAGVDFENRAIAFDKFGNMYFTEGVSRSIVKRAPDGTMTVLVTAAAITGVTGAAEANPRGVDIGADGFLYVTDSASDSVLKVNRNSGVVSVFVNEASLLSAATGAIPGFSSVSIKTSLSATNDGKVYVASDGFPDTIFELAADGTPTVLASGLSPFDTTPMLYDLDVFMTVQPGTGHLVVGNDGSGGGGDDGHPAPFEPDQFLRLRRTDGALDVFISEAFLDALAGMEVDLEGGIAFDSDGNFYFGDLSTQSIYKMTSGGIGSLFVAAVDIVAVTGVAPNFEAGMAFAPVPAPEPTTAMLGVISIAGLTLSLRRRRH